MERLNRFVMVGAVLGALALLITLATEGRVLAQAVRAALVENVDEPGRNPYSENTGCFAKGCNAIFSAVPAGKRLVVTFVNAEIENGPGFMALTGHGTDVRIFTTTSASVFDVLNAPTWTYFDAGERPSLGCDGCNSSFAGGTLSGYYVNLP